MSDWPTVRLGEVAWFRGGHGFSEVFQGRSEGELPFFKVSDMSGDGNERALLMANHYVSRTLASSQGWKTITPPAVAFAKVGAALLLNRRRLIQRDSLVDNNMMATVTGPSVDTTWLYWWLQTIDFGLIVQPGALPSVNQSQLGALSLRIPPLAEQRKIAEILDTIDEAIRKTEEIIAKLKQVKQGLLHDLLTRGIDDNGELRDPERFPEQFKESALGRIPKGWETDRLGSVGTWVSGGTPSKSNAKYWSGHIPWVSPKDMKVFRLSRTQDQISDSGVQSGSRLVPPGTVFVVVRGMILAHTFPVCLADLPMAFNQDVKGIVPRDGLLGEYLAYWFVANAQLMLSIVTEATHGTKRIDLGDLHAQTTALPAVPEQQRILAVLRTQQARIDGEQRELSKLRLMKQGLMEDLLAGQVRVTSLLEHST